MKTILSILFVLLMVTISSWSLPVMRMKLCVASTNPYKLQNQCVFCHNKRFPNTVRSCTGAPYLPANVSIEEGYCMVRQCRTQMPSMRPEPFFANNADSIGINADDGLGGMGTYDLYGNNNLGHNIGHNYPMIAKPVRRRPPAQVFVGKPLRPFRPGLFGKRSIPDMTYMELKTPGIMDDDGWDTFYVDLNKRQGGLVTMNVLASNVTTSHNVDNGKAYLQT